MSNPGVVIRVIGIVGVETYDLPVWLASYDLEARDGLGFFALTTVKDRALVFPDHMAAVSAWRQSSRVRPFRDDGQPNRPMTAYTVEIQRADDRAEVS